MDRAAVSSSDGLDQLRIVVADITHSLTHGIVPVLAARARDRQTALVVLVEQASDCPRAEPGPGRGGRRMAGDRPWPQVTCKGRRAEVAGQGTTFGPAGPPNVQSGSRPAQMGCRRQPHSDATTRLVRIATYVPEQPFGVQRGSVEAKSCRIPVAWLRSLPVFGDRWVSFAIASLVSFGCM